MQIDHPNNLLVFNTTKLRTKIINLEICLLVASSTILVRCITKDRGIFWSRQRRDYADIFEPIRENMLNCKK